MGKVTNIILVLFAIGAVIALIKNYHAKLVWALFLITLIGVGFYKFMHWFIEQEFE